MSSQAGRELEAALGDKLCLVPVIRRVAWLRRPYLWEQKGRRGV